MEQPYFFAISFCGILPMDIAATISSFVACENIFLPVFFAIDGVRGLVCITFRIINDKNKNDKM